MLMTACFSLPWLDNPMGWPIRTHPKDRLNVLYLDWETNRKTINDTKKSLTLGMNLGCFGMHYRHCKVPLARDLAQIIYWIDETKADITIIDSLGRATGGDLNSTEPALAFWDAWNKLETTSLIIAHPSKGGEDKTKRSIFGSMFFSAEARIIWEVRKAQEAGSREADVALYHIKPPPFDMLRPPIGLHVSFNKDADGRNSTIVRVGFPETIPELLESMSAGDRIIAELKNNGDMTNKELSNALCIKSNTVTQTLNRLQGRGEVKKISKDKWSYLSVR